MIAPYRAEYERERYEVVTDFVSLQGISKSPDSIGVQMIGWLGEGERIEEEEKDLIQNEDVRFVIQSNR